MEDNEKIVFEIMIEEAEQFDCLKFKAKEGEFMYVHDILSEFDDMILGGQVKNKIITA